MSTLPCCAVLRFEVIFAACSQASQFKPPLQMQPSTLPSRAQFFSPLPTVAAAVSTPCRHLGTFLNGQRATMREPSVFFSLLTTFCDDLEAAHEDNRRADEAAAQRAAAQLARVRRSAVRAKCQLIIALMPWECDRCVEGARARQPEPQAKQALFPLQAGKKALASPGATSEDSPMRQHDKVLTTVRVFSRLKPDQRKALLTEKVCGGWGGVGSWALECVARVFSAIKKNVEVCGSWLRSGCTSEQCWRGAACREPRSGCGGSTSSGGTVWLQSACPPWCNRRRLALRAQRHRQ